MSDQQRLRPAFAYDQSDQSLCWSFEYSMTAKLLTEHHLEFLRLKGGCTGSPPRGGGGGGNLIFSTYISSVSTIHPQKYEEFQAPKIYENLKI